MADEYFATLAYDHRVMCGFYDHAPVRESYELPSIEASDEPDDAVPFFDFDIDDDIII